MKTLTLTLEYSPDSLTADEAKEQVKNKLEGSELKLVSLSEDMESTDSSYDKMHSSMPDQPKGADPDVNSTGAGGMVSPDSSGYPNKK
ncbi:hypothetical protein [Bacillus sp. Marseille-Q1617]|uniref:hypothetical protein n=1 Tax=Bacillus sp. Marseille-Q1617 TaxID=2736887 RepID=UPI00158973AF|nr:hypothetical protein [Bacillus sp. Marseille-Q1617]